MHIQFDKQRSEMENKYRSEIHILNQKNIEFETKHLHQIEMIKKTTDTK